MSVNTIRFDSSRWKFGVELLHPAVFNAEAVVGVSVVRRLVAENSQRLFLPWPFTESKRRYERAKVRDEKFTQGRDVGFL